MTKHRAPANTTYHAPRRSAPGEVPWTPECHYRCSKNPAHMVQADKPVQRPGCVVYVHGSPCPGTLEPVGPKGGRVRSAS